MNFRPRLVEGLQFDTVDDGYIVREVGSDWVHYLNPTAMLVVLQCDGTKSADDIARFIQELHGLGTPPNREVDDVLAQLEAQALLRDAAAAVGAEIATTVSMTPQITRGEATHA